MVTINATEARNNIGKLWDAASREPVTVESAGKPIAIVMSPEENVRLTRKRTPRQSGGMRQLFAGVDVNELLATPVDDVFAEHL